MKKATIVEVPDGKKIAFKVMLGDHEIGTSKTDFDARFHMHAINDALEVAHLEGARYLERMVEQRRVDEEFQKVQMKAAAEHYRLMIEMACGTEKRGLFEEGSGI